MYNYTEHGTGGRARGEATSLSINEDETASWQTQSNLAVSLFLCSFGGASFHPRALPASNYYYCCHQGSYGAAVPTLSVAAIVVVACSRYNESCHLLARPPAHTSLSLGPPSRRCIVRLLSWMGAAAKGPPACVRDDNALEARRHRKEGRKKERRQSLREEEDVEEREVEQKGPPPGNEYG